MKIIACVGDGNGMLFHNRRVSSDRVVTEDIMQMIFRKRADGEGTRLWMNRNSSKLFEKYSDKICVSETFLEEAGREDFCFVENACLKGRESEVTEVVLYRWNRKYPADVRFSMELSEWKLEECIEFQGYSHEKITKEVFVR